MSTESARVSHRKLTMSALALGLIAALVVVSGLATRSSRAAQLRERVQSQTVPTVALIKPDAAGAASTLDLPGRIEAFARAPLYARVSGYLKSWKVDIGAKVRAGQLLAEIETPDLDQQLLQAEAELASARSNAALATSTSKRWQSMLANDSVSRQEAEEKSGDLSTKQSAVNALQANVERFQALKRFARILAPFDGVVTARATDVGALINVGAGPGSELFVVSDTKKLRVYVNLPQNYVAAVRQGSKARLSVPENPGKVYAATVQSLAQSINSGSGSMLIQLTVDNDRADLLPGGFANLSFELPRARGRLSIPPSALINGRGGLRVALVGADGKVTLKSVSVARDLGAVIEIATGLSASDQVIESPPDGLADGDLVRVAPASAKAAAAQPSGKPESGKQ